MGFRGYLVCNGGKGIVALSEIGRHSTECADCSAVTTLVDRVQQCCDTFDDVDSREDNALWIWQTVTILASMQKLANDVDFLCMH